LNRQQIHEGNKNWFNIYRGCHQKEFSRKTWVGKTKKKMVRWLDV
jgi:hypothetical protein